MWGAKEMDGLTSIGQFCGMHIVIRLASIKTYTLLLCLLLYIACCRPVELKHSRWLRSKWTVKLRAILLSCSPNSSSPSPDYQSYKWKSGYKSLHKTLIISAISLSVLRNSALIIAYTESLSTQCPCTDFLSNCVWVLSRNFSALIPNLQKNSCRSTLLAKICEFFEFELWLIGPTKTLPSTAANNHPIQTSDFNDGERCWKTKRGQPYAILVFYLYLKFSVGRECLQQSVGWEVQIVGKRVFFLGNQSS